jgi:hypothetical protein
MWRCCRLSLISFRAVEICVGGFFCRCIGERAMEVLREEAGDRR